MQAKEVGNWQVMEKAAGRGVLNKLRPADSRAMFSSHLSQVTRKTLPFYDTFELYRVTDYSTLPSFRLDYLGDGEVFYLLDGTASPIYKVNDYIKLELSKEHVAKYLRFFFKYAENALGEIYLIESPDDIPTAETLSANQKTLIARKFQPLDIAEESSQNRYMAVATLLYQGALVVAQIILTQDGRVTIKDQQLLLKGEHIPAQSTDSY